MFYQPGITEHNLPRDPYKACVIPRPIGWIATKNSKGQDNLAPFSQFNNLTFDPPYVMFSSNQTMNGERKDTVINVEETGHFVWNLATWELREAVNITAEQVPYGVDEFERAKLTKEPAKLIDVPMVQESPVKFECQYYTTMRLPGNPPIGTVDVVVAKVIAVHINDDVLTDGILDVKKTQPIARCGYNQYAVVRETFDMIIPGTQNAMYGLEGSVAGNRARHLQNQEAKKRDGANI